MAESIETTFVTTMGGQAQVVTFALDWLLAQGEAVHDVVVVHLSPASPRVKHALSQLAAEFSGDRYAGRPCRFRHVAIQANGEALADLRNEADAAGISACITSCRKAITMGLTHPLTAPNDRTGTVYTTTGPMPRVLALTAAARAVMPSASTTIPCESSSTI
jgi:hypothetical protein